MDSLVTPAWLAAHHDEVRIVDLRWYLGGKSAAAEYAKGHLPGAVFLDLDRDLSGDPARGPGRHPLPTPAQMEAAMAKAGIGALTDVVAYDDAGGSIAARLWYLLRLFGHRAGAAVLDGGLPAWLAGGHPLENGGPAAAPGGPAAAPGGPAAASGGPAAAPSGPAAAPGGPAAAPGGPAAAPGGPAAAPGGPAAAPGGPAADPGGPGPAAAPGGPAAAPGGPGPAAAPGGPGSDPDAAATHTPAGQRYAPGLTRPPDPPFRADPSRLATWILDRAAIAGSRADPTTLLLDARARERYRGDLEPIDARPGHVPGARSAPWSDNLEGGRFRAPAALRQRFTALGADQAERVAAYCGSGVTACHDLLALHLAGYPDERLRLYEGSWSDWARDANLPAILGENPE